MKKIIFLLTGVCLFTLIACGNTKEKAVTSSNQNPSLTEISVENMMFTPETITVKPNTTVKWTNNDSVEHTIKIDNANIEKNLKPSDEFSYKFIELNSYNYSCTIHPDMKGLIVVEK